MENLLLCIVSALAGNEISILISVDGFFMLIIIYIKILIQQYLVGCWTSGWLQSSYIFLMLSVLWICFWSLGFLCPICSYILLMKVMVLVQIFFFCHMSVLYVSPSYHLCLSYKEDFSGIGKTLWLPFILLLILIFNYFRPDQVLLLSCMDPRALLNLYSVMIKPFQRR